MEENYIKTGEKDLKMHLLRLYKLKFLPGKNESQR